MSEKSNLLASMTKRLQEERKMHNDTLRLACNLLLKAASRLASAEAEIEILQQRCNNQKEQLQLWEGFRDDTPEAG